MVDIGVMYANGDGVQTDLGKAAMWYNRAADLGNPGGMVNLGWLYEYGKGVETDVSRAAMWYRRAADLGNAFGMMDLALLYAQGKGVQRDDGCRGRAQPEGREPRELDGHEQPRLDAAERPGRERRDPEEAAELMMKALDRRNEFSRQRMTQHSELLDPRIPPSPAESSCATPASIRDRSTAASASPPSPPSTPTSIAAANQRRSARRRASPAARSGDRMAAGNVLSRPTPTHSNA